MDKKEKKSDASEKEKKKSDASEEKKRHFYQKAEMILILQAPVMMLCHVLMHFSIDMKISAVYHQKPNKGVAASAKNPVVEHETALWMMMILSVESVMTIISVLIIHFLGEVYSRKVGMLVSLIGSVIKTLLITIIMYFNLQLRFLVLVSFASGFTGGYASLITNVVSHIADEEKSSESSHKRFARAQSFAIGYSGIIAILFTCIMQYANYFIASIFLLINSLLSVCFLIFFYKKSDLVKVDFEFKILKDSLIDVCNIQVLNRCMLLCFFLSVNPIYFFPVAGQSFFLMQSFMNEPFKLSIFVNGLHIAILCLSYHALYEIHKRHCKLKHIAITLTMCLCLIIGFLTSIFQAPSWKFYSLIATYVNTVINYMITILLVKVVIKHIKPSKHGYLYALMLSVHSFGRISMLLINLYLYWSPSIGYRETIYNLSSAIYFWAVVCQIKYAASLVTCTTTDNDHES